MAGRFKRKHNISPIMVNDMMSIWKILLFLICIKKTTATALIQERYTPPPQKPFRYRIIHLGYTVFMFDNISSPAARPLLCLSPILCTVLCFKGWIKSKKIWNPTFCMLRKFINAIHETSTIILLYYYYYVAHKFIHFLTNDDDILYISIYII